MKGKKRLIALLLSFLMVLSQMSVATFALDTVADENSDQTVEEQAVEETQPEADVKTAAAEAEPAAEETAAEPEVAQPAAAEPAKAEPAKAEEKKAEPEKAEAREEAFDQSQTLEGVTVNVSAAKGVFPAGSKLSVSKVAVPGAVDTSDAEAAYAFDISILANGEKIQPDGKATVSFTTAEVAEHDVEVYHMDGGAQEMSVSENGDTATVTTDGFSVYVVKFIYLAGADQHESSKTLEYQGIKTGETKTLFQVFKEIRDLGLGDPEGSRQIDSCVSSDPTLLKVESTAGEGQGNTLSTIKLSVPENATSGMSELTVVSGDTTIKFHVYVTLEYYEVSFDLKGGKIGDKEKIDNQNVPLSDGKATDPGKPTKNNCIFEGWYEEGADKPFDFDTIITKDTKLEARYHSWFYNKESDVVGKVYCKNAGCPYNKGFFIELDAEDVLHVGDATKYIKLVDPSSKEGFPKDYYTVGQIEYYKGTITKEEDFDGKTPVSEATVNSTEGFYTARVKITENANNPGKNEHSLFQPFQVVSAGPIAAEGLVYKDGRCVVADDDMRPEGTSAIVLYKHPTTGKYVRREKLLNDGSIPIGETKIDYIVLPNDDYDPENPEKYQIGYGDVTIDIAGRMFTISYDLNGGKLNGQTGVVTTKVEEGTVITLPSPTRSGYKFDYWEGSRYNAGDKYTVTADHTFKAVWKANKKGVDTGDTNDIAGLLALMIASVGALGAIGYRRRKEDQ